MMEEEIRRLNEMVRNLSSRVDALEKILDARVKINHEAPSSVENSGVFGSLRELGYKPRWDPEKKCVVFYHKGNKVTFFPKKGWFSGKGLEDGHGLDNLISQLKGDLAPVKIIKP